MPDVLRFLSLLAIAVLYCGGSPSCCDFHLVTGPHGVSDDAFTASSTHRHCPIQLARINSSSAWCPADRNNGHYIQVKLRHVSFLRSIMTRGRKNTDQRVLKYIVSTSMDGLTWSYIRTSKGYLKVFPGNVDQDTAVTNELEGTAVAKYIRVTCVRTENTYGSMRLEVQGCPVSREYGTCSRWKGKLGSTGDVLPVLIDTDAPNQGLCGVKCYKQPECHSFLFDVSSARCRLLKATPEGSQDTVNLDGVWYFVNT